MKTTAVLSVLAATAAAQVTIPLGYPRVVVGNPYGYTPRPYYTGAYGGLGSYYGNRYGYNSGYYGGGDRATRDYCIRLNVDSSRLPYVCQNYCNARNRTPWWC